MMKKRLLIFCTLFLTLMSVTNIASCQKKVLGVDSTFIQFSGIVVMADSLNAVPFATIILTNSRTGYKYGTISDLGGFFSFVAQRGDTVDFTSVGFKPATYVIPDTIRNDRYSLFQLMFRDTIFLEETVIYPWPSKEEFADAFVHMDIPDDDITIGLKNLEQAGLSSAYKLYANDGSANYKYNINQQTDKYDKMGSVPTNPLLNVFAWMQFFKAWKSGAFKVDKDEQKALKEQKKKDIQRWDYDEWIEK